MFLQLLVLLQLYCASKEPRLIKPCFLGYLKSHSEFYCNQPFFKLGSRRIGTDFAEVQLNRVVNAVAGKAAQREFSSRLQNIFYENMFLELST